MDTNHHHNICDDDKRPPGLHAYDPRRCFIFIYNHLKTITMGKIKDNWQLALFTVCITILGSGIWTYFQNRDSHIDKSATVEYVDIKHNEQKIYIDEQDRDIIQRLDRVQAVQQNKADKTEVDKVYEMSVENNKLLIEVLMRLNELK